MRKNLWKAMIATLCLVMTMAFTACGSETASGFDNTPNSSSSSSSSAPTDETPEDDGDEPLDPAPNPEPEPQPQPETQKWTSNF
jgi:hypothetical protein